MEEFQCCQICFERFDTKDHIPLLLVKCQHSYCSKCLKNIYKSKRLTNQLDCPECRTRTNQRFEELPKNRLILQFLELNQEKTNTNHINVPMFHDFSNSAPIPATKTTTTTAQGWNERKFFQEIFNDIDHNHDGRINFTELHEALLRGMPNSQFDAKTVKVLLDKYDNDNNGEIDFSEFYNLFIGINSQYNEFLDIDEDFSGLIDSKELTSSLAKKGYNLNGQFIDGLMYQINRYSSRSKDGASFDMYVRIVARLDKLKSNFSKKTSDRGSFENFIIQNFFIEF